MTRPSAPRSGRLGWVGLGVLLLLVAFVAGAPPDDDRPLDPRSTGELGTRGLVLVLEELGVDVDITVDPPTDARDTDSVLVLADDLRDAQRDQLRRYVEAGGRLVVTDPSSSLLPRAPSESASGVFGSASIGRGTCDLPALSGLDRVDPTGGTLLTVEPGDRSCFGDGDDAFVVEVDLGEGTVVGVGGAGAATNVVLDTFDNAPLFVQLLAPEPGMRVTVLEPDLTGEGDKSLIELIPTRVAHALWQLLIAFGVVVLWRIRRHGRPVVESQPVEIAGSELTVAVGHLLQRARHTQRAVDALRAGLRSELAGRFGSTVRTPTDHETLARLVAERTGLEPAICEDAIVDSAVTEEADLLRVGASIDAVRERID